MTFVQDKLESTKSQINKKVEFNLRVIRRIEDHIDDITNRNRRNNIVIHGVPEGSEAGQTCEEFVHDLLTNQLKLEAANSIEIVLTAPVNHQTWLQTWLQPAHVDQGLSIADYFATVIDITSLKKSPKFLKNNKYKGQNIFITDDVTPKIRAQRKEQRDVPPAHPERRSGSFRLYSMASASNDQIQGERWPL